MIIPDINLLIYAYNQDAPFHRHAKNWWEDQISRAVVGIPWVVSMGFVRLITHPRVVQHPLDGAEAVRVVKSWLDLPQVQIALPGPKHLDVLTQLLGQAAAERNRRAPQHDGENALRRTARSG